MKYRFFLFVFCLVVVSFILACSSSDSETEEDAGSTASLTTFQDLPELDVSHYDTSSDYYNAPNLSLATRSREATSTGEFSRTGCELKTMKNEMLTLGIWAEEFLCLYKIPEQYYPEDLIIPTGSFAYYTLEEQSGEGEMSAMTTRIGYFPDGYGNVSEAVLVIDECESGSTQTAEMRVTASTVTESIVGSGYYIRLNELVEDDETEEMVGLVYDTRETLWSFRGSFTAGSDDYGSITMGYDTTSEYNTISAFMHDAIDAENFDVTMNAAFGPANTLPEDYTVGGSAHIDVAGQDMTNGFVFNDSTTLPAIGLTADTDAELPFYAEMTAMGDLPTVSEPNLDFIDGWDCEIPEGTTAIEIDLTPTEIDYALTACEATDDVLDELDDYCRNLDPNEEE